MANELFGKKIDNNNELPDIMSDYIKVSTPSVWIVLMSFVLFLIGLIMWAYLGRITQSITCVVHVEENVSECIIYDDQFDMVKIGMMVEIDDTKGIIDSISKTDDARYICKLSMQDELAEGVYEGKIIIQQIRPLDLIVN